MNNDIALFLDLDNVVIGTTEANLRFDVNEVLDYIQKLTNGRIVLRRAYGDWRQHETLPKELASAGFELSSIVRLNSMSKNLADMQMVVDSMETLVDGHNFSTYVLITGDRDFVPLIQALRKRGKQVIGIGVKHTASRSLMNLCDTFVFYEELVQASKELLEAHLERLLTQALDEVLQEQSRVPASLLKQQVHLLSHGAFARSPFGKRGFRKFLEQYPAIVRLEQEETTLYVTRPHPGAEPPAAPPVEAPRHLDSEGIETLIARAVTEVAPDDKWESAAALKQRMVDLSNGAFDRSVQGDQSFHRFLKQFAHLVDVQRRGTSVYIRQTKKESPPVSALVAPNHRPFNEAEIEALLCRALDSLLQDQPRARASLLKQRLQELSHGAFDEPQQGNKSFRDFIARYPHLLAVQQTGTTLYVSRPQAEDESEALHLRYRTLLKKRGLRVIPHEIRLSVLKDVITLLQGRRELPWRELIDLVAHYHHERGDANFSRNYIQDVLRVARRAEVIEVLNGNDSLANAAVKLELGGPRAFQDAVLRCDAAYLQEIRSLGLPVDLDEAAIALYETPAYARYLKVVVHRLPALSPQPSANSLSSPTPNIRALASGNGDSADALLAAES